MFGLDGDDDEGEEDELLLELETDPPLITRGAGLDGDGLDRTLGVDLTLGVLRILGALLTFGVERIDGVDLILLCGNDPVEDEFRDDEVDPEMTFGRGLEFI